MCEQFIHLALHLWVLQPFQVHIQKWCKTTDKILLAVSGGMDSMVMLRLFHQAGYAIAVAHCNFQLRSAEANGDEEFVKAKCAQWNIPFFCKRFDTNNYASENGLSIQMAARELRYAWFNELLEKEKIDWMAIAHHLNDSIETVLLNLTKGAGIEGLLGIPAQNKKIIRPLLFATREEIENYAAEEGIAWREDESNESDDYQRNFIRHQVVTKLKEINPSLEKTFEETTKKLHGANEMMGVWVERWKKENLKTDGDKTLIDKNGFDRNLFSTNYHSLLLYEILKEYDYNFDQCENIFKAIDGQAGKRFLSATHELIVDRANLILIKQQEELNKVILAADQHEIALGKWQLNFEAKHGNALPAPNKNMAGLDAAFIQFPLTWRRWKAGDSFFPLGMKHRKKVSDFLIDEKISLPDKEWVTVLESAGEIVWVVGLRIDERFKVTLGTERTVQFRLQAVGFTPQAATGE
jgi:tRNA(Ile)-lysidine synthase